MIETLGQSLLDSIKSFPKSEFLLYKKEGKYVPISMAEFAAEVKFLCFGLKALGLQKGDKLVILSENRPEWVMVDYANLCAGGITVPIYTTLVPEQVKYIVDNCDAQIVVCSNSSQWEKIKTVRQDLTKVRHFITLGEEAPEGVLTYSQVLDKGKAMAATEPGLFERMVLALNQDDDASIIYTSGTTGIPKGVVLTHINFLSNIKTVAEIIEFSFKDTVLSFLPLSHVLERMVMFTYVYRGCTIAFAESTETVAENLLEVRPQIMVSVPRVFEKIYSKVMDNVLSSSALKKKIFFWAVRVGKAYGRKKLRRQPVSAFLRFKRNLAHRLVFSKIIERTGGRVRFFVSGGAPLSKDIAEFFYALGLVVLEGYGLTETAPVLAVNTFQDLKFGTVGKPIPGIELKIASDGEILAKGPNVMKGYYKKEAETREAIEDGWFKTGDIGYLDEEGFLVITDRKKDLIVTSGGKNVAPQPIENLLKTNSYISNAVVLGDRKRFISALIVPNFEKLEEYAKFNSISYRERIDLVRDKRIVSLLKSEVDRATPNLASYERVKKISLLDRDFEIERGEMTPTLKVKRNHVEEKYRDLIEAMYKEE